MSRIVNLKRKKNLKFDRIDVSQRAEAKFKTPVDDDYDDDDECDNEDEDDDELMRPS